jgi:hypothetical protein
MKSSILTFLIFLSLGANALERRQLNPEFQELMILIERDITLIEEGLKLGSRKEALEQLLEYRQRDLKSYPSLLLPWQKKVEQLSLENLELKAHLENLGEEVVCRVRLFGHEFLGLGTNESSARARAILLCSETYDYLLECSKARVLCP